MQVLLGAIYLSFRQALTGLPLSFASRYRLLTTRCSTVIFLQRAFTSSVHAHAGRTQYVQWDLLQRDLVVFHAAALYSHTTKTHCKMPLNAALCF